MNDQAIRSVAEHRRNWNDRPLAGKRIVLTRPRDQAGDFEERVRALGGEPLIAPAIAIVPPDSWAQADAALGRVEHYDWIAFTSANAVRAWVERSDALGLARRVLGERRLAAVGPATAAALAREVRAPDVVATTHVAEALADALPDAEGAHVLFPRGEIARDALAAGLRRRGAVVDDVVVYCTVPGGGVPMVVECLREGTADAILFASASAVHFVADALRRADGNTSARTERERPGADATHPGRPAIFCLGPVTAAAARAAGLDPVGHANWATPNELIAGVARWFASRGAEE